MFSTDVTRQFLVSTAEHANITARISLILDSKDPGVIRMKNAKRFGLYFTNYEVGLFSTFQKKKQRVG